MTHQKTLDQKSIVTLQFSIPPQHLIDWLLEGDVSIQYQVHADLLAAPISFACPPVIMDPVDTQNLKALKERISQEGWGYELLSRQQDNGHWGLGFYQPKWISTHYTLLDLRNLCCNSTEGIGKILQILLKENKARDGGINPIGTIKVSDVCINGMFLNYASYFNAPESELQSIIDFIMDEQMPDGGFNCRHNRSKVHHSSMHSTICVLEGIHEYLKQGYSYRRKPLKAVEHEARNFLLMHHLYKSDHTGEVIHPSMTRMPYPSRWKYDILRSLDYFAAAQVPYDDRMQDALELLISKQRPDGTWPIHARHPGEIHFEMEKAGGPGRMNTLRALRILRAYEPWILNKVL